MGLVLSPEFNSGEINPRTEAVDIPSHVASVMFIDMPKNPQWILRGLTDVELARLQMEAATNSDMRKLVQAATKSGKEKTDAALEIMGLNDPSKVPTHLIINREMLRIGSVDPVLDGQQVLRFFKAFPVFAKELASVVDKLTGLGADVGKRQSSTAKSS